MIEHLTSIVAIDRGGAIGCKNQLPWSIKSDMAFFRETTTGNTVIMGRKTFDSIGGCLKGRQNLILSHNFSLFASTDSCKLVTSTNEALAAAEVQGSDETFVIGGAATYSAFAPWVDQYLVTMVDHLSPDADSFLSEEIQGEFAHWDSQLIRSAPAVEGRDQFPFKIMRFTAPDAAERREIRKSIAHQLRSQHVKQMRNSRQRGGGDAAAQVAFSF